MSEEAKEKILNAAEKEFSVKGFDGARVDKIAKAAGVNKALIYYYFKSKKELLKALYERLVHSGFSSFDLTALADNLSGQENEKEHEALHKIISFLDSHRDIIRIILMESLKGNEENMLLDLADFYIKFADDGIIENAENLDKKQFMMTELFTALIPMICYTLFKDDLQNRISVSQDEMDHYFMNSMKETHFKSHKK